MRGNIGLLLVVPLLALTVAVVNCGGGGGGTGDTHVVKTSVLDGSWVHSPTESEVNGMIDIYNSCLLSTVLFNDGNFHATEASYTTCVSTDPDYLQCLMNPNNWSSGRYRDGQFTITGNTLTINNVIYNGDSTMGNHTCACNITVSNDTLVFTNSSGRATYFKQ